MFIFTQKHHPLYGILNTLRHSDTEIGIECLKNLARLMSTDYSFKPLLLECLKPCIGVLQTLLTKYNKLKGCLMPG